MIYFFAKGGDHLQCEIHWGRPHVLTLIAPDGASESERYSSSGDLTERWEQLADALADRGWTGPFGGDPRS